MDRMNGLSDDIICHTLSFLGIKESALTSILSKRWRNLFAFTPNLHFDDREVGSGQSFIDLIDRLLVVSGNFPLRKISIKCRKSIINLEVSDHVTRWMKRALNRGVLDINIDIITSGEVILVPLEIFTSKTMVELKLGKLFYAMSPEVVYLPSLKTLYLDTMLYHFREAIPVFSNLIRLTITTHFYSYHWKYFPIFVKKSPYLHTLIIKGPLPVYKFEGEYGSCPVKVLKITEYGGTIADQEKMKHFLEKLSSLELVKVCACAINDKEKDRITKDLLMVPRSSKCNIKIKFMRKLNNLICSHIYS